MRSVLNDDADLPPRQLTLGICDRNGSLTAFEAGVPACSRRKPGAMSTWVHNQVVLTARGNIS